MSELTWGDSNTVAIDDGSLLFLLLRGVDAGFLHVADRLVSLPLALGAGSGARQQLVSYI